MGPTVIDLLWITYLFFEKKKNANIPDLVNIGSCVLLIVLFWYSIKEDRLESGSIIKIFSPKL